MEHGQPRVVSAVAPLENCTSTLEGCASWRVTLATGVGPLWATGWKRSESALLEKARGDSAAPPLARTAPAASTAGKPSVLLRIVASPPSKAALCAGPALAAVLGRRQRSITDLIAPLDPLAKAPKMRCFRKAPTSEWSVMEGGDTAEIAVTRFGPRVRFTRAAAIRACAIRSGAR